MCLNNEIIKMQLDLFLNWKRIDFRFIGKSLQADSNDKIHLKISFHLISCKVDFGNDRIKNLKKKK